MKNDIIAKRYAMALYELGREEGLEKVLFEDLEKIVSVVKESEEFKNIMESPLYDIILKKRILDGVVARLSLNQYSLNFLKILLEKDRFEYAGEIMEAYRQILDEASGKVRAKVLSATTLDVDETNKIAQTLSKLVDKEVAVDVTVEPSLIGGVVAEVEGMVYDGSIKNQLNKVKQSLKGEI